MASRNTALSLNKSLPLLDSKNDVSNRTKAASIFISYSWRGPYIQLVRDLANFLRKSEGIQKVWIDIEEMYPGSDIDVKMREGITECDIFICCYCRSYPDRENCMKEFFFAVEKHKLILPVNVQEKGYEPDQKIKFHIPQKMWTDLLHTDHRLTIYNAISKLMREHFTLERCRSAVPAPPATVRTFGMPSLVYNSKRLFKRAKETAEATNLLINAAKKPDQGVVLIYGEAGCGKSTIVTSIVESKDFQQRLIKETKTEIVVWINCIFWDSLRGQRFDAVQAKVFDLRVASVVRFELPQNAILSDFDIPKIVRHFEPQRILFILDDVFSVELLVHLKSNYLKSACCAITRDPDHILKHSAFDGIPNFRLLHLSENETKTMLGTTFELRKHLSADQIDALAERSCSLPLIGTLIASQFNTCVTAFDYQNEFELLKKCHLITLKRNCGSEPDRDAVIVREQVAALFEYSINRLTKEDRSCYVAILLFDPEELISVQTLSVLWGAYNFGGSCEPKDRNETIHICRNLVRQGLLRQAGKDGSASYMIHEVLRSTAIASLQNNFSEHEDIVTLTVGASLAIQQLGLGTLFKQLPNVDHLTGQLIGAIFRNNLEDALDVIIRKTHVHPLDVFRKASEIGNPDVYIGSEDLLLIRREICWAAERGYYDVAQFLIEKFPDVNDLHLLSKSAAMDNFELARLLLQSRLWDDLPHSNENSKVSFSKETPTELQRLLSGKWQAELLNKTDDQGCIILKRIVDIETDEEYDSRLISAILDVVPLDPKTDLIDLKDLEGLRGTQKLEVELQMKNLNRAEPMLSIITDEAILEHIASKRYDAAVKKDELFIVQPALFNKPDVVQRAVFAFESAFAAIKRYDSEDDRIVRCLNWLAYYYSVSCKAEIKANSSGAITARQMAMIITELLLTIYGSDDPICAAQCYIARAVCMGNPCEEQRKSYETALKLLDANGDKRHKLYDVLYRNFGVHYEESNNWQLAFDFYCKWHEACSAIYGPGHSRTTDAAKVLKRVIFQKISKARHSVV